MTRHLRLTRIGPGEYEGRICGRYVWIARVGRTSWSAFGLPGPGPVMRAGTLRALRRLLDMRASAAGTAGNRLKPYTAS